MGNIAYLKAYNIADIIKAIISIAIGWLAYHLIFKKLAIYVPRVLEEFEHLVGVMSLTIIFLFWMVLS